MSIALAGAKMEEYGRSPDTVKLYHVDQDLSDIWPRDWALSVHTGKDGKPVVVIPSPWEWDGEKESGVSHRPDIMQKLKERLPFTLMGAPFPFDGGNIFFDIDQRGEPRVLVGHDIVVPREARDFNSKASTITAYERRRRVKVLRDFFGTKVEIIGDGMQPAAIYHLICVC